ncbi:MAG: RimK/LysX family protein [Candidatus Saccharimonas sp.]
MTSIKKTIKTVQDLQEFKISTRWLLEIALEKGYEVTYFYSSPSTQSGIARCRKKGKEFFIKSTCTLLTPSLGVYAAENKSLTYSLLAGNDVPMPEMLSRLVAAPIDDEVLAFMKRHGKIVVKPAAMNHGDGVSVGVDTVEKLEKAVAYVKSITTNDSDIIYQRQVEGKEYRFLVVAGKVVAVSHRRPPFVIGDGVHNVRELIIEKNLDPRRGDAHTSVLTRISFEDVERHNESDFLKTVPKEGEEVTLLSTSNLSRGGEAMDYTDVASAAIKSIAEEAARYCFLGVAGIDIISQDITAETRDGSYVIEVNLTPGVRMHEAPSVGQPRQVSRLIFKAIEKTAQPAGQKTPPVTIGRVEKVKIPTIAERVHARIDTGAKTSAIWASNISETGGVLQFHLFNEASDHFANEVISTSNYSQTVVASSNGATEIRYKVKLPVVLKNRRINASFTLTDRSSQVYPLLIGRNVLRGKFIVDTKQGAPLISQERRRTEHLRKGLA